MPKVYLVIMIMIFLLAGQTAFAQDITEKTKEGIQETDSGKIFMNIGRVVVQERGDFNKTIDLPGSVDVIGSDQIDKEVVDNSLNLLRMVPGITIGDYGNGGVPNGFTLRGFDLNSHGNHTVVTIDGIPINTPFFQADGTPDLNQLTPEEVERVEIVKGPIDARYGNWSRAGVIHFHTRTRGDFQKAKVSYGSWNTQKVYVTHGSEHLNDKFNQIYSVEYYTSDGWRDNSERRRQNAYAKWFYRPTEDIQIGLNLHGYKAHWYTAGYIGEEQWKADPRSAFAAAENDGGYRDTNEAAIHLDWKISENMPLEIRLWMMDDTASRYADWGSGQTEDHWDTDVYGIVSNLGWDIDMGEDSHLRLDTGVDWRRFEGDNGNYKTDARSRTELKKDEEYSLNNGGIYLKANYDPFRFLRAFAGIRYDIFSGDWEDHKNKTSDDMKDYDVVTYKGGIIGNITDRYSLYANVGTTYQLPYKTDKYKADAPDEKDLWYWEVGIRANPVDWAFVRYAYFRNSEDLTRWIEGVYVNEGDTIRRGHELEVNITPFAGLEVFTALTLQEAEYDGGENDGNELPHIPDYIWKLGLQYELSQGSGVRIWYNDVGKWYTDSANDHDYEGYSVVDLKIYHRLAEKWMLSLDIKNLFDETYSEFVSHWSGTNQYAGSNAQAFYVTLKYDF